MTRRSWIGRLRAIVARRQVEQELSEELDFHLEMQARKHRGTGMDPAEAKTLARREFGNVEVVKEDARDMRGVRPFEDAVQDVRYAIRSFTRAPAFALALVVTIGLGVGVSSSAFAVFNAYVLRPFDVRDPASLYSVNWMDRSGHYHDFRRSDLDALRGASAAVSDVAGFRTLAARLSASAAVGDAVTGNYFQMLGVRPMLGRTFAPSEIATPVVVVSYTAWLTRFAADSSLVGRRVLLRGTPFQVIGVTPPGFSGLFKKPRDFWVPLEAVARFDSTVDLGASSQSEMSVIARLGSGTSEARGRAAVDAVLHSTTASRPDSGRVARVFFESRASPIPPSLKTYAAFAPLVVAFGLILLLACANVANMLLARGLERRRELGIRLALGAARARLVRQLVTESIVLTLPAAALGFGLGRVIVDGGLRAVFATLPSDLAQFVRFVPLTPDWRVAAFAVAATVVCAFLCGLTPSLRATRLRVVQATRGEFGDGSAPRAEHRALIVGQITVSSLLLITAALLLRQAAGLGRAETGLRTVDVVSIESPLARRSRVLEVLRSSSLVDSIAASTTLPLDMRFATVPIVGDSATADISYNRVSASYFDVLGIGVAAGRLLTRADEQAGSPVVVVSETAARRLWPNANPVGRTLRLHPRSDAGDSLARFQNALVVGVARDVVVRSIDDGRHVPVLYFPNRVESDGCCLLARVRGDPAASKRALGAALDRAIPGGVDRIDRLDTFVVGAIYPYRLAYVAALALGLIALALTVVGVYGVVAYLVGQRTKEIGIRIALGATTRDVVTLVMRQSVRQAIVGATIGLVLALALARLVAANVPGIPVFDAVAVAAGSACVLAACCVAAFLPSRRASKVDPTAALRYD